MAGEYYVTSTLCGAFETALGIAYDLGRARGREDTYNGSVSSFEDFDAFTKRLRVKVRRLAELEPATGGAEKR